MPEYLAPGVYVEEVDTGSKPIEGVSTSTAGMIGATERGPVNVPIPITSYGEFTRWFGERLRIVDFTNANGPHCYLPQGVEGFFTNGGKRLFVVRVLDVGGAANAALDLGDRGDANSAFSLLLRPARAGDGTNASPLYVLNVNDPFPDTGTLDPTDRVRIGGGSDAESRIVQAVQAANAGTHLPFQFALARTHDGGATLDNINRVPAAAPNAFTLAAAAARDAASVDVAVAAPTDIAEDDLLEIGPTTASAEHRFARRVQDLGSGQVRVTLDSPLALAHALNDPVAKLESSPPNPADTINANTLDAAAPAASAVVFVTAPRNDFTDPDSLVIVARGDSAVREARRIGQPGLLTLSLGGRDGYAAGVAVEAVTLPVDGAVAAKSLRAAAEAGASVLDVNNRTSLVAGDLIRIGVAPDEEYAVVDSLPNQAPGGAAPDAGRVVLQQPLLRARAAGVEVRRMTPPTPDANLPTAVVLLPVERDGRFVPISDGRPGAAPPNTFAANAIVRLTTATGGVFYHRLADDSAALDARPVELDAPLLRNHPAGAPVAGRAALFSVVALDPGAWGNRLRISVSDEETGLVSNTTLAQFGPATSIRLASAAGVEVGTLLEVADATGAFTDPPLKVTAINRTTGDITLAGGGLLPGQQAIGRAVRSREFSLTVRLLRQPDPALPSRNNNVIDLEAFRNLSMDPRHSRYLHRIVGTTFTIGSPNDDDGAPVRLSDRRSEGESAYVRVRDLGATQAIREGIRLGPEALVDTLANGTRQPARHPPAGGDDSIPTLDDDEYIGVDNPTPENRTGLVALRNVEEISIVAAPGRTSMRLQGALIEHCEFMRYRFAVLDGPPPPTDALADVQAQRQQFDTKYAAMYYPWLLVPDPFPLNLTKIPEYAIPPSGHVMGLYARTDVERGVHKAPANEVLRGIVGLRRVLNKEQHDLLNPYPVNISVIRDFRPNNRGIRVFGGRVISSDSDWKYVNVRRLLIFLEASIDRGLQWVVFEPSAEPLWARVRRTISDFLTVVWRNGALEGTKPEEAYFVKCDRTTMTQLDIDSGRLIAVVGVAPVKPAEFVIIRIGLWTRSAEQ